MRFVNVRMLNCLRATSEVPDRIVKHDELDWLMKLKTRLWCMLFVTHETMKQLRSMTFYGKRLLL